MYFNNTSQSPSPEVPSALSSSGQKGSTEQNPVTPTVLSEDMPPPSAVAPGHIPAAEIALAKQIRADLDAELGRTHASQTVSSPPPSKGSRRKKVVVPLPDAEFEVMLQDVYYDNAGRHFWKKSPAGPWMNLNPQSLVIHLMRAGMPNRPADGDCVSQIEEFVARVQEERCIDVHTAIGGYRTGLKEFGDIRILVKTEPKFITPVQGDWSMLNGIFNNMFKDEQLPYIYGWIKVALDMFHQQSYMAGQVLVLCGEREAGKNLFVRLLRDLFGGRLPGKPYSYMTRGTDFNSDFIGKELLTIEDEVSLTSFNARRAFGAKIKDLAVNEDQRLHRKGVEAVSVQPLQRLVISLNDEPERMQILPPLDPDIEDKIMLIKMFRHKMPMPTSTAQERKAFQDVLVGQLPAFLHFLKGWQVPQGLVASRFGIKHFHHPDLVDALQQQSPEQHLLRLIDEVLFLGGSASHIWEGLTNDLDRKLKDSSVASIAREASDLLRGNVQCGTYLGRLANKYPNRIRRISKSGGCQKWLIKPPLREDEDADETILFPEPARPSKHLPSAELQKKIAEIRARGQNSPPAVKAASGDAGNQAAQCQALAKEEGVKQAASSESPSLPDSEFATEAVSDEAGGEAEILTAQDGAVACAQVLPVKGEGGPGVCVSGAGGAMEVACGAERKEPAE